MSKKPTRKEKISFQQQGHLGKGETQKIISNSIQLKKTKRIIGFAIALLGFLLYANTLGHQYVLDDFSLIKENYQTQKGVSALKEIFSSGYRAGYFAAGEDVYRPLSKAMFAIEWQLSPDKPGLSHLVNVILYALTGMLLFYVLTLYLPNVVWLCAVASFLFIVHPIHTEVVANIKSRDEILCLLFFLLTSFFVFKYIQTNSFIQIILAVVAFFLSLLSKESAVTFLVLIPIMIYFFTPAETKKQVTVFAALSFAILVFLIIRMKVLHSGPITPQSITDNLLVAAPDKLSQFATAVYIMGIYLKLLFVPHPLVSDYSFNQIPIIGVADWKFLLSFIIYALAATFAIIRFKQKNTWVFGILFFFITASLVSNIVVLIGTSFGERLMYTPSLGFCIAIGALLIHVFKINETQANTMSVFYKLNTKFVLMFGLIVLLFGFKTYSRNKAWESNYVLHSTDVLLSPNSARAHYYYGNIITQDEYLAKINDPVAKKATLDTALREMRRTLQIYPGYADAFHKIGKIYLNENLLDSAAFYYRKALTFMPTNSMYLNNLGSVLFNQGKLDEALRQFEQSLKINPMQSDAYSNLASVYGTMGQQLSAQHKMDEARKNFETAIVYFKKAVEVDVNYAAGYYMLGLTYRNLGDESNAQFYINIAKKLNPNYK
ncbi:MAG: tetratricopeptide repeat protein [Bacteroidia bacterium]|nr:tetratricopeptide repeat protein [Bacteroidia bacterium]